MCYLFCLCALDDSGMTCTECYFCRGLHGADEGGRKECFKAQANLQNHKLAVEIVDMLPAFAIVKLFERLVFRLTISL